MTDSNAAARVTGSGSISRSVPRQQASPPDHRVPLPAPRCPPVPRRLLWHDSSGKEEEDQGLQARVPAGILEERAHGSGQWGYSHIRNSCDTLLNPCRVFCLVAWSLQRSQSPGHERGGRLLTQRDWTWTLEPPPPTSLKPYCDCDRGLQSGSTHLCLTASSDARPHSVGIGRVPVSSAAPQACRALLAAPDHHLHLHSHGLHPEHSL